jgi:hypothetical protein
MSGTTTSSKTNTSSEPSWAKPGIGVYGLSLFLACLVVAVVTKNTEAQLLLIGAVIPMAQTVVGYYYGSSSGSEKKTDLLAASSPVPVPATPSVVHTDTVTSSTATPVPTPVPTPTPAPVRP